MQEVVGLNPTGSTHGVEVLMVTCRPVQSEIVGSIPMCSAYIVLLGNWLTRQTVNLIPSGRVGSSPTSTTTARVMKLVNMADLKSVGYSLVGSSPIPGTCPRSSRNRTSDYGLEDMGLSPIGGALSRCRQTGKVA